MATGTVVVTEDKINPFLHKVTWAWTSTAGGAAGDVTTNYYTGVLVRAVQIPGGTTPTTAYDVVVTDADGADVLHGTGADIPSSAILNKAAKDGLGAVVNSKLTLAVTNAGASKTGSTVVYIQAR